MKSEEGEKIRKIISRKKKGIVKSCIFCSDKFYEYPYLKGERSFCSTDCANKYNKEKNSLSKLREKNPMYRKQPWNYIDGKSSSRKMDSRYYAWRNEVLERDDYTCQMCSKKMHKEKLVSHHKKSWRDFPKLRYKVDNGVALCRPCHNKIHNIIWLKKTKVGLMPKGKLKSLVILGM